MVVQLIVAIVGLIALIAGAIVAYYAVSFLVLRCVGLLFPLTGRNRKRR
jgi:hypothetical protein